MGIIDQYGNTVLPIQYDLIQRIKGTDMIQVSSSEKGTFEIYFQWNYVHKSGQGTLRQLTCTKII